MNFYDGNEFDFISTHSLYESKSKIRTRQKDPDQFKNHAINMVIVKFNLQASIDKETKTML